MKKLTWWFRIVGSFYLLLALVNAAMLFVGRTQTFADTLPAPMDADPLAVRSFMDAWLVFILELGVLGAMAWVASRAPMENKIMAWVIIWAELFRGVLADAIWISRGYDPASYAAFIAIHVAIIATGILFVRQARAV